MPEPGAPVRVAVDAVPLLDTRTGVGRFVHETTSRLAADRSLSLVAYGWPLGGKQALQTVLPTGVAVARLPMAGPPLRAAWRRVNAPPIELWTGRVDVVHGPNFVVPPAWRARELVTVHDLTVLRHPGAVYRRHARVPVAVTPIPTSGGVGAHGLGVRTRRGDRPAGGTTRARGRRSRMGSPPPHRVTPHAAGAWRRVIATSSPSARSSHARTSHGWSTPSIGWHRISPT